MMEEESKSSFHPLEINGDIFDETNNSQQQKGKVIIDESRNIYYPIPLQERERDYEERECRYCLCHEFSIDDEGDDDYPKVSDEKTRINYQSEKEMYYEIKGEWVSPCKCSGTSRWVHRGCLDDYRSKSYNVDCFWKCVECNHPFSIMTLHYDPQKLHLAHRSKMRWFMFKVVLTILLSVLIFGGTIASLDVYLPNSSHQPLKLANFLMRTKTPHTFSPIVLVLIYGLTGVTATFTLLGIMAVCHFFYRLCCAHPSEVSRLPRTSSYLDCYFCTNTDPCCCLSVPVRGCNGMCSSEGDCCGGSDDGEGCVICAVIVVILLCIFGLLAMIYYCGVWMNALRRKHSEMVKLQLAVPYSKVLNYENLFISVTN